MADQIDRYRGPYTVLGSQEQWTLRGPVRGGRLVEHREEAGLLDAEWRRLQAEQDQLVAERAEFERRSWIVAAWELVGFALIVLLGLLLMAAGNGFLPR